MRSDLPKPQSGAGCGVSKARSGRHVCGPEFVAALALLSSGGAQPETAITQPSAKRIESLDEYAGLGRKPLAPGWTKPKAGRNLAPAPAAAALKATDMRRVIRREDVPELSCIAVVEPVVLIYEIGAPQQFKSRVPSPFNRRHGLDCDHHARVRRIFRISHTAHIALRTACSNGAWAADQAWLLWG